MFKLKNVNIQVDRMTIKNNHLEQGEFKLNPNLSRKIGQLKDSVYYTELRLIIKDEPDFRFPIDLEINIKAIFSFEDIKEETKKDIDLFLKKQGVHILYPYLRSAVSNLTTNALLPPVVLPIINAMTLFEEK